MYRVLFTSNSIKKSFFKSGNLVVLVACVASGALAQGEWNSGSRFEIGGDENSEYSEVTPYIGYDYITHSASFSTLISSPFSSYYENYWSEGWESNNDISWNSSTRLLSVTGSYDHEYDYDSTDDTSQTTNDFSLALGVNIPQSARVVHQFSIAVLYQSEKDESDEGDYTVDETTGIASYDFVLRQNRQVEWSSGIEQEVTDSDTQITTGSLGWDYNTSRYDMAANGYLIFSDYDGSERESYGWDASISFKSKAYTLSLSAERSVTDNLSFTLDSDLDIEIEQQYLATITEASLSFSDYALTKTLNISVSGTVGVNESLYDIPEAGISSSDEYDYFQLNGELQWRLSERSLLTASIEQSEVDGDKERIIDLLYTKDISDYWSASAYIEKEITYYDGFSWYLSAVYKF